MAGCMCIWTDGCGGSGLLMCAGCGGDLCICRCGGETECPGCDECRDADGGFEDDEPYIDDPDGL